MEFNHDNVRRVEEGDRLSSLPDELILKILSYLDMKLAVQTCLLSSRWEFLWTSMSHLNFNCIYFRHLHKFSQFVTHVLSHRNHQKEVSLCISSFPDILSHHPSPFSNLICLTIDYSLKEEVLEVKMSAEARNFFIGNSPSATFIFKLPKVQVQSRGWWY
ncbi:hypothetical protein L2E82_41995 [Cichorium intybus]|uniref:Uncharacterized protein n=1 Tax=Cichorium intybus TaxID=13427 RepID=A0ACB8ZM86_CICIN|nr:hypothetical protein L2E82_41995 [Cichorium intybus]